MGGEETAKLFRHGGSRAVRLPKDFRLPGEVRVRRLGRGVLLEPIDRNVADIHAIFAEIDRRGGPGSCLKTGRRRGPFPMSKRRMEAEVLRFHWPRLTLRSTGDLAEERERVLE
jgi:antitoxin VapB